MRMGILQGEGNHHDIDVGCADADQVEGRGVIISANDEISDFGAVGAQMEEFFSVHRHFSRLISRHHCDDSG